VLGGARSGKSRLAEGLFAGNPPVWTYIATAQAFDAEMAERIAAHRARRDERWMTVDAPLALAEALDRTHGPALIDCLTLWLTNLILGEQALEPAFRDLEAALSRRQSLTVLVSNEVGLGLVPETPLGRKFRDEAGLLHQRLARIASHVTFVAAGLPLTLKQP
jgi:adenosyl cobinamide kinase/adenosyl cobinamide phosphate guanylyltransferase